MVRKSRKSREEWKIMHNVFDNFTERRIHKLITEGHFEGLYGQICLGKEANIFSARRKDGSFVIVKIYRLESCNFRQMFDYIKQDERYEKLKKQKREIIFSWAQREFRNLMIAREAGVRVPRPMVIKDHIIVMELIGDGEKVAPQLKDEQPENPEEYYKTVAEYMKKLYHNGLVHGDLSKFNILTHRDKPVFIDFSQSTTVRSRQSEELLERDAKNIVNHFLKLGLKVDEKELKEEIIK